MLNNHVRHSSTPSLHALVVEDDEQTQLAHKATLIELGYQVDLASSGEEAISMIENHYDVILLDIGLPGINGIDVAITFRCHKKHRKTPIIASTTCANIDRKLCFYSGIAEILAKPLNIQTLGLAIFKYRQSNNKIGAGKNICKC